MKPTKLIPTLAITATLLLTACGSGDEGQATESTPTPEETQATPVEEGPTQEQVTPDEEYQAALDVLGNPLGEDERYEIGYEACIAMLTDATGTGEFLDQIERDNIDLGSDRMTVLLLRAGVDEPQSDAVTRAAIEYICPEVKDKMTDDAMKSSVFRDDYIAELEG